MESVLQCKTCHETMPPVYRGQTLIKTCEKCREKRLKKEKERKKKLEEERAKLPPIDAEKYTRCNYKKCEVVFEKFKTSHGEYSKKCPDHAKLAYKHCKNFEDRIKNLVEERKEKLDEPNLNVCNHCAEYFVRFLKFGNKQSERCQDCQMKEKKSKDKYYSENPHKYEELKMRKRLLQAYKLYRAKKIAEIGLEAYRAHNSRIHSEYFQKNKEKLLDDLAKNKQKLENRYKKLVREAKEKRNIEIKLTFEEFSDIVIGQNCYYCGSFEKIGVDRIESSEWYEIDNCIPCCDTCNMIKNTVDVYSFVHKCKNIVKYNNLYEVNEDFIYDIEHLYTNPTEFYLYARRAKKNNLDFSLMYDDYETIINKECYLCGQKNTKNGIDRVDSKLGYVINNCKPCCSSCNYMKRQFSLDYFLNHILKIYQKCYKNLKNIKCTPYGFIQNTRRNFTEEEKKQLKIEKWSNNDSVMLKKHDIEKAKRELEERKKLLK